MPPRAATADTSIIQLRTNYIGDGATKEVIQEFRRAADRCGVIIEGDARVEAAQSHIDFYFATPAPLGNLSALWAVLRDYLTLHRNWRTVWLHPRVFSQDRSSWR